MSTNEWDLIVVGGGAGGLAAAREARRRGHDVALVADAPLGGDCTFTGCVPSKTLIEAAAAGRSADDALAAVHRVVAHVAGSESAEVLRAEGVEVVDGRGRLHGDGSVEVDGRRLRPRRGTVLALGASAAVPPIPGLAEAMAAGTARTTDTFWELDALPARLAVLGAGAIGCELAMACARLGVEVTLVDLAPRVLSREEPDVSAIIDARLEAMGVRRVLGVGLAGVTGTPTGLALAIDGTTGVEADVLLVAVGRRPRTDGTDLAEAGIELTDRGAIDVDDGLATSVDRVWAVGDVTGLMPFTHAADAMGRTAATNALGRVQRFRPETFDTDLVPWVTFTDPEVARIGVTEAEAASRFEGAMVAELPLDEHDRALAAGHTDGVIRIVAAPRPGLGMRGGGRIVGATIVAPRAGEMIAEISLAMRLGAFTGRLAQAIHPYPTWSYGIPKAIGQFFTTVEGRTARPARA